MIYSFIVSGAYLIHFSMANNFIVVWIIYLWHIFSTGSLLSRIGMFHEYLYFYRLPGQ